MIHAHWWIHISYLSAKKLSQDFVSPISDLNAKILELEIKKIPPKAKPLNEVIQLTLGLE